MLVYAEIANLNTFEQLGLAAPILRSLAEEKYDTPTPIQAQTIVPAMSGRDVLGCAQTGTGKTAAFALPILHQLHEHPGKVIPKHPLVLVLAPTRELAIQIGESFTTYGRHLRISTALVYGGVGQDKQVRAVERGVHVVIATPGRLLDLMQQQHISLSRLRIFVLDEADRMMDMGFLPDLRKIIAALPKQRQSLFFSATMPQNILDLSAKLLSNPVRVHVEPSRPTVELIEQRVVFVEQSQKKALLTRILRSGEVGLAIAFTRTKRGANALAEHLTRGGIAALAIHGNKSQNARERALEAFRSEKIQVLVATDLAARGIDIDGVTHVFNVELPSEPESYVHRIGRTGRAGASGIAIAFCGSGERGDLRAIEKLIGQKIPVAHYEMPPREAPSEAVSERRSGPARPQRGSRPQGSNSPAKESRDPGTNSGSGRSGRGRPSSGSQGRSSAAAAGRPSGRVESVRDDFGADVFGEGVSLPASGSHLGQRGPSDASRRSSSGEHRRPARTHTQSGGARKEGGAAPSGLPGSDRGLAAVRRRRRGQMRRRRADTAG
ncbi:MAG: DEAD/DEAH box helicase [Planctomyces sp.]